MHYGSDPSTRIIAMGKTSSARMRASAVVAVGGVALGLVWSCSPSSSDDPAFKSAVKVVCIRGVKGSLPSDTTIRVGDVATVRADYDALTRTCDTVKFDPTNWTSDNTSVVSVVKLTNSNLAPQHGQITGVTPG